MQELLIFGLIVCVIASIFAIETISRREKKIEKELKEQQDCTQYYKNLYFELLTRKEGKALKHKNKNKEQATVNGVPVSTTYL